MEKINYYLDVKFTKMSILPKYIFRFNAIPWGRVQLGNMQYIILMLI